MDLAARAIAAAIVLTPFVAAALLGRFGIRSATEPDPVTDITLMLICAAMTVDGVWLAANAHSMGLL